MNAYLYILIFLIAVEIHISLIRMMCRRCGEVVWCSLPPNHIDPLRCRLELDFPGESAINIVFFCHRGPRPIYDGDSRGRRGYFRINPPQDNSQTIPVSLRHMTTNTKLSVSMRHHAVALYFFISFYEWYNGFFIISIVIYAMQSIILWHHIVASMYF